MDATVTDPLVGRMLDGRYRIEVRVARGGMASVYAATDTRLDRVVAVKVMHAALADDDEFVARFIREARSAARLSHPNVVAVYDQGADGDVVYLVMEYVEGCTLRDLLAERGRLRPGEALAVMEPVLAALAAAHDAGIVHRDVKPENVLLAADGRVKVADFGLARAIAEAHLTGSAPMLIGTVAYLSPEQVDQGRADARSDVYSAGIVLFELLTGHPPYKGETPIAVAYRHVRDDVPSPSSLVPGLPRQLDDLVRRATSRDPLARPVDAGAFLVALARVRDRVGYHDTIPRPGLALPTARSSDTARFAADPGTTRIGTTPIGTTPLGATPAGTEPPRRPARARRRRWPIVLVVLLLLVAAAAGVAGWWYGSGRNTSAPGLLDLSYHDAAGRAAHDGLRLHAGTPTYSDTVPKGEVVSQVPAPLAQMRRGGVVLVHLSLGVLTKSVPKLAGDTVDRATALLARSTFGVSGKRPAYSLTVRTGLVVTTDPPPGKVLRHGSAVLLVVSAGPPPVHVPAVVGVPLAKAESQLTAAGLRYTAAPPVYSTTVPAGDVVSQTPGGGATLTEGSPVTLTPSKGPQLFLVPAVTYDHVAQATAVLKAAGFKVAVQALPMGPGLVLRESPAGNSMQPHGTTITLYVF